jgi:uncharacterized protein (TIGR02118 family)
MIKLIGTARRRADFSTEDFFRYWREVHAPISARPPGLRGYVVSEVTSQLAGDREVDAFIEQWWDDVDAYKAAAASDEAAAAWDDVANYARTDGAFWLAREHVLRERRYEDSGLLRGGTGLEPGRVKMIGAAKRRDDFTVDAFFDYWRDVHAPIGGAAPGMQGYVIAQLDEAVAGVWDIDAFIELWWPLPESFDAAGASPEMATAWEDVGNYARTDQPFWLCREHIFIAPPATGPGLLGV